MLKNTVNLKYQSNLTIPFGKLQTVLDWCNHNCEKNWAWSQSDIFYIPPNNINKVLYDYTFSFESEKDYIAFILVHE
jgi:hypothetical protein